MACGGTSLVVLGESRTGNRLVIRIARRHDGRHRKSRSASLDVRHSAAKRQCHTAACRLREHGAFGPDAEFVCGALWSWPDIGEATPRMGVR
jgi:hypothetical protein